MLTRTRDACKPLRSLGPGSVGRRRLPAERERIRPAAAVHQAVVPPLINSARSTCWNHLPLPRLRRAGARAAGRRLAAGPPPAGRGRARGPAGDRLVRGLPTGCGLVAGHPWLGPAAPRDDRRRRSGAAGSAASPKGRRSRGALAPAIAVVALLARHAVPAATASTADGAFRLDPFVAPDTAFHVGLTYELATGYPPQVPGCRRLPPRLPPRARPRPRGRLALGRRAALRPDRRGSTSPVGALMLVLLLRGIVHALGGSAARGGARTLDAPRHRLLVRVRGEPAGALVGGPPARQPARVAGAREPDRARAGPRPRGASSRSPRTSATGARAPLVLAVAAGRRRCRSSRSSSARTCCSGSAARSCCAGGRARSLVVAVPGGARDGGARPRPGRHHGRREPRSPRPRRAPRARRSGSRPLSGLALAASRSLWLVASLGVRAGRRCRRPRAALRDGPVVRHGPRRHGPRRLAARPALPRGRARVARPGRRSSTTPRTSSSRAAPLLWIFTAIAIGRWPAARARWAIPLLALLALPSTLQFVVKKALLPTTPCPRRACAPCARSRWRAGRATSCCSGRARAIPRCPSCWPGGASPTSASRRTSRSSSSREDAQRRHETVYRFFRTDDVGDAAAIARELRRALRLPVRDRPRALRPRGRSRDPVFEETGRALLPPARRLEATRQLASRPSRQRLARNRWASRHARCVTSPTVACAPEFARPRSYRVCRGAATGESGRCAPRCSHCAVAARSSGRSSRRLARDRAADCRKPAVEPASPSPPTLACILLVARLVPGVRLRAAAPPPWRSRQPGRTPAEQVTDPIALAFACSRSSRRSRPTDGCSTRSSCFARSAAT